jgi:hypothetical protein
MFESLVILLPFVLVPASAVVCILALFALGFHRRVGRMVRRTWPGLARKSHIVVPVVAFCVALFLLIAAGMSAGAYQQYWLNEPLCTAAGEGDIGTVERLLDEGGSPDAWGIDYVDLAIVAAASGGHSDIVALLIEHGADVNGRNSAGYCALDAARAEGHEDIVQMLIQAGADPD